MTLGPTQWFLDWYEEPKTIEIPLAAIPSTSISFTYPDSMMSLLIAEDRFEPFARFKQPYHGEVFRLEELGTSSLSMGSPTKPTKTISNTETGSLKPRSGTTLS